MRPVPHREDGGFQASAAQRGPARTSLPGCSMRGSLHPLPAPASGRTRVCSGFAVASGATIVVSAWCETTPAPPDLPPRTVRRDPVPCGEMAAIVRAAKGAERSFFGKHQVVGSARFFPSLDSWGSGRSIGAGCAPLPGPPRQGEGVGRWLGARGCLRLEAAPSPLRGGLGWGGEESGPGGPAPHQRRRSFGSLSVAPLGTISRGGRS